MSISKNKASLLEALDRYADFLGAIPEDEFARTPAPGTWSLSEVYSHLLSANRSSLFAVESCLRGKRTSAGSVSLAGRLVLFFGRLPFKVRAPESMLAQVKKISREEAGNELELFRKRFLEVAGECQKAPENNRLKHPRLGMLNARQWVRFIEIHTWHHYRQLLRVKKQLDEQR